MTDLGIDLGSLELGAYAITAAPAGGLIASGNVGLGTVSPGSNLSVLGGISTGFYATTAVPTGALLYPATWEYG